MHPSECCSLLLRMMLHTAHSIYEPGEVAKIYGCRGKSETGQGQTGGRCGLHTIIIGLQKCPPKNSPHHNESGKLRASSVPSLFSFIQTSGNLKMSRCLKFDKLSRPSWGMPWSKGMPHIALRPCESHTNNEQFWFLVCLILFDPFWKRWPVNPIRIEFRIHLLQGGKISESIALLSGEILAGRGGTAKGGQHPSGGDNREGTASCYSCYSQTRWEDGRFIWNRLILHPYFKVDLNLGSSPPNSASRVLAPWRDHFHQMTMAKVIVIMLATMELL